MPWGLLQPGQPRATVVALRFREGGSHKRAVEYRLEAEIAHVGDSRAYLLRAEHLQRLTEDHSVAAELARSEALASTDRNQESADSVPGYRSLILTPDDDIVEGRQQDLVQECEHAIEATSPIYYSECLNRSFRCNLSPYSVGKDSFSIGESVSWIGLS